MLSADILCGFPTELQLRGCPDLDAISSQIGFRAISGSELRPYEETQLPEMDPFRNPHLVESPGGCCCFPQAVDRLDQAGWGWHTAGDLTASKGGTIESRTGVKIPRPRNIWQARVADSGLHKTASAVQTEAKGCVRVPWRAAAAVLGHDP